MKEAGSREINLFPLLLKNVDRLIRTLREWIMDE